MIATSDSRALRHFCSVHYDKYHVQQTTCFVMIEDTTGFTLPRVGAARVLYQGQLVGPRLSGAKKISDCCSGSGLKL